MLCSALTFSVAGLPGSLETSQVAVETKLPYHTRLIIKIKNKHGYQASIMFGTKFLRDERKKLNDRRVIIPLLIH